MSESFLEVPSLPKNNAEYFMPYRLLQGGGWGNCYSRTYDQNYNITHDTPNIKAWTEDMGNEYLREFSQAMKAAHVGNAPEYSSILPMNATRRGDDITVTSQTDNVRIAARDAARAIKAAQAQDFEEAGIQTWGGLPYGPQIGFRHDPIPYIPLFPMLGNCGDEPVKNASEKWKEPKDINLSIEEDLQGVAICLQALWSQDMRDSALATGVNLWRELQALGQRVRELGRLDRGKENREGEDKSVSFGSLEETEARVLKSEHSDSAPLDNLPDMSNMNFLGKWQDFVDENWPLEKQVTELIHLVAGGEGGLGLKFPETTGTGDGGSATPPVVDGGAAATGAAVNSPPDWPGRDKQLNIFSQEVVELIDKSPTLQRQLRENGDVPIAFGPEEKGTYYLRTRSITIDSAEAGDPRSLVRNLAHEIAHASYPVDFDSKQSRLNSEGFAQLSTIRVRDEILANGGPDIGISNNLDTTEVYSYIYYEIYKKGFIDEATAIKIMGETYGKYEHTSIRPDLTYDQHYGEVCPNP